MWLPSTEQFGPPWLKTCKRPVWHTWFIVSKFFHTFSHKNWDIFEYALRHLPEALKTFRETNDVLDHVSCEVSHVWKSSENTAFSELITLLVLFFFKGAIETRGGRRKGGGEGAGIRGLACRLVALTHRKDVSVHRLIKKTSVGQLKTMTMAHFKTCLQSFAHPKATEAVKCWVKCAVVATDKFLNCFLLLRWKLYWCVVHLLLLDSSPPL